MIHPKTHPNTPELPNNVDARRAQINGKPQARFEHRFVNGIWTIFDHVRFTNCEPDLGTEKNAVRLLNAPAR